MATSTVTLYSDASTSASFALQGTTGMKTTYINQASSLHLPDSLTINHRTKAAGANGSDTHQVLKQLAVQSSKGEVGFVSENLQFSVSRNDGITDTIVVAEVAKFISYFIGAPTSEQLTKLTGVVTSLIDGVTP
jgi:hypothetical protein